jgi:hypothetical protein
MAQVTDTEERRPRGLCACGNPLRSYQRVCEECYVANGWRLWGQAKSLGSKKTPLWLTRAAGSDAE